MDDIKTYELKEILYYFKPEEVYSDQLVIMEISGHDMTKYNQNIFPLRFEAYSIIMVCSGEMVVSMDYLPYTLGQNMVLELANRHLMNDFRVSHDFKGYYLIMGKTILEHVFEEIIQVPIPKEYAINRRNNPIQKLEVKEFQLLLTVIERLRENLGRKEHIFYKGLVLNEVRNFIMELFNIGMNKIAKGGEHIEVNHFEELAVRFMQLLVTKCKEWNEVSQYSTELCVTPVYLSRTVKSLSGKTAMDWINTARVGEAKMLLRKPTNTVQDVADMFNFSDQSSFGKFFKKHTGMSPLEYKRNLRK